MARESVRRRARSFQAQLAQYQRAFEALVAELKRESRAGGGSSATGGGSRAATARPSSASEAPGEAAARDKLRLQAEVLRLAAVAEQRSADLAAERARAAAGARQATARLKEARGRLDELRQRAASLERDKLATDERCEALEQALLDKQRQDMEAERGAEAELAKRLDELRLDYPDGDWQTMTNRLQEDVAGLQEAMRTACEDQLSRAEQLKSKIQSLSKITTSLKNKVISRGEMTAELGVTVCTHQEAYISLPAKEVAPDLHKLPTAA